jgi:hypothetical protein
MKSSSNIQASHALINKNELRFFCVQYKEKERKKRKTGRGQAAALRSPQTADQRVMWSQSGYGAYDVSMI